MDVELTVKDKFPLHGSVELNNRYSANTTPLRLDAAVSYGNLWQRGHTVGGAFQIAPQRISDALIYSGYYILPAPSIDWLSLMFSAIRQNSEVSTLGEQVRWEMEKSMAGSFWLPSRLKQVFITRQALVLTTRTLHRTCLLVIRLFRVLSPIGQSV